MPEKIVIWTEMKDYRLLTEKTRIAGMVSRYDAERGHREEEKCTRKSQRIEKKMTVGLK